jgi:hypothetical protein
LGFWETQSVKTYKNDTNISTYIRNTRVRKTLLISACLLKMVPCRPQIHLQLLAVATKCSSCKDANFY